MTHHDNPNDHISSEDGEFGGPVENPAKLPEWDSKSVEEDGPGSEPVEEPVTGADPDIDPDPAK